MNLLQPRSDEDYMRLALAEAKKAYELGEVPIGALMVSEQGQILARAHNQVEALRDGTAHAEMLVISMAQVALGDWRLDGCTLYVTKEPCPMCAGAIINCRPSRVVYGCRDLRAGAAGGWINLLDSNPPLNHRCELRYGVLEEECLEILRSFFREARKNAKQRRKLRELEEEAKLLPQEDLLELDFSSKPLSAEGLQPDSA